MIAGKLNEVITILKSEDIKDSYGATSKVWNPITTTKASVNQNTGTRSVVNNEIFTAYTVEFGVRFYTPVSEFDRVMWNGKKYQIESVIIDRLKNHKIIITTLVNE